MAKKNKNEFLRELSEQMGGKIDGMLDTLGLSDISDEELMDILTTTLSEPKGIMKSFADKYYSYDAPDYSSMIAPVAIPFLPLVNLKKDNLPIVEKMRDVCTQFDPDVLNKELLNVFYVLLNDFLKNRKDQVVEAHDEEEEPWSFAMLVVMYLMHINGCKDTLTAVVESLHQGVEFYISHYDFGREDFIPVIVAEMGFEYLPTWDAIMKERGVLIEMKKMLLVGVTRMVNLNPDALAEIQEWMVGIAQEYVKVADYEGLFDETLLDSLSFCCIHTRSVDAKNALISLYGKYKIPTIMVGGGANEVRKTIKKAMLGIEVISETLEDFMEEEETFLIHRDDDDGDDDWEDWDDEDEEGCEDEEGYEDEEEYEDEHEDYEPLGAIYSLDDVKFGKSEIKGSGIPEKYTLRISLSGIKPEIWREIEVPSSLRLTSLAICMEKVMGWEFEHMHNIKKDNKYYCTTSMEYADGELDGSKYAIKDLLKKVGETFLFTYDFGDNWEHTVKLIAKEDYPHGATLKMHFLDGERNCPPEDCGGMWGYRNLCEAMKKPNSKQAREIIEWLGGIYDPELFPKKR